MPRPKVKAGDKKDRLIQIKFSLKDKILLDKAAQEEHIALTTLLRKWILEKLEQGQKEA